MKYIVFSISIAFISWIVGMILNALIKNQPFYNNISNLNFIKSKTLNKRIGIGVFKWIVKNSFFKYFNQKIKLNNKIEKTDLKNIRMEMTIAEISHLIGFIFVTVIALYKSVSINYLFGLTIMIVNILMNLYPSLLQQENKRRIDRLIEIVVNKA